MAVSRSHVLSMYFYYSTSCVSSSSSEGSNYRIEFFQGKMETPYAMLWSSMFVWSVLRVCEREERFVRAVKQ